MVESVDPLADIATIVGAPKSELLNLKSNNPRRNAALNELCTAPTLETSSDTRAKAPPERLDVSVRLEEPKPGAQLGPYEIVSEIGRGGMGLVLRARDVALKREVAIKTLLPNARLNSALERRFIQEAQISGRLEHPGITPVHLLGHDEQGNAFFSMKLVSGRSLEEILAKLKAKDPQAVSQFPLTRLISIFERVCETIGFAHSNSIIHRDLKPANVMIGDYGEVWVLDWGLAKVLDHSNTHLTRAAGSKQRSSPAPRAVNESSLTLDGTVVGTPGYMAPEQVTGDELDQRVDIFGLGGLLREILCGSPPFTGRTLEEVLTNTARHRLRPLPKKVRGQPLPRVLAAITLKCLERERSRRYASTNELLRDLRAYVNGEPVSALPEGVLERLTRFARRNSRVLVYSGAVVALFAAVVLIAGVTVWRADRQKQAAEQAQLTAEQAKLTAEQAQLKAELEKKSVLAVSAEKSERRVRAFDPYAEALDLLGRGQLPDRAVELLHKALELDPEFEEAQYSLAEALRAAGRPPEAGVAYLRADELSRKATGKPNIKALVHAGLTFHDVEMYVESEDAFAAVERSTTSDPLAEVGRILAATQTRRLKEALAPAEALVRRAPYLWEAHLAYACILVEAARDGVIPFQQSFETAVSELKKCMDLSPRQALVLSTAALTLGYHKQIEDGLKLLNRAIDLEPKNGYRIFSRWQMEYDLNKYEEAARDLAEACRLGVDNMHRSYAEALLALKPNTPAYNPEKAFTILAKMQHPTRNWPAFTMYWGSLGITLGHASEVRPVIELHRNATHVLRRTLSVG